jgi:hypothetical protein
MSNKDNTPITDELASEAAKLRVMGRLYTDSGRELDLNQDETIEAVQRGLALNAQERPAENLRSIAQAHEDLQQQQQCAAAGDKTATVQVRKLSTLLQLLEREADFHRAQAVLYGEADPRPSA